MNIDDLLCRVDTYTSQDLHNALAKAGVTALIYSEIPKPLQPHNLFPNNERIDYETAVAVWDKIRYILKATHGMDIGECTLHPGERHNQHKELKEPVPIDIPRLLLAITMGLVTLYFAFLCLKILTVGHASPLLARPKEIHPPPKL